MRSFIPIVIDQTGTSIGVYEIIQIDFNKLWNEVKQELPRDNRNANHYKLIHPEASEWILNKSEHTIHIIIPAPVSCRAVYNFEKNPYGPSAEYFVNPFDCKVNLWVVIEEITKYLKEIKKQDSASKIYIEMNRFLTIDKIECVLDKENKDNSHFKFPVEFYIDE